MRHTATPGRRGKALVRTAAASAVALLLPACSTARSDTAAAQSFTMSLSTAPTSLDSAKDYSAPNIMGLVNNLLEDLGSNGSLTPALATSVSTPNDTTLVYHLRKDVRFSDGTPLTARDVAWSIQHDFAATSVVSGSLKYFKDAGVTGADEVTVHLTHYDPTARQLIGNSAFVYEAAQAQAHPKDFGSPAAIPVGTGPYRVASFTAGGVVLERNSHYWGTAPRFNQIKFVYIAQDNTAQLAMRSGSIQAALVFNPKAISTWRSTPDVRLYPLQPPGTSFVSMDVTSAPFNDLHLRRAIAYAIDRPGLAQAIYHGEAQLTHSVVTADLISGVAPSVAGANDFLSHLPSYGLDLAKARAELAQSAYPRGLTVKLPYPSSDGASTLIAQSMQYTLGSIGITVQLQPLSLTDWSTQVLAHKDLGIQLDVDFAGPGTNDPNNTLGILVGQANAVADGINYANYYPPAVEHAWQTMTQSTNRSARWQATRDILAGIATDLPYVPLFTAPTLVALGGGFRFPDGGVYQNAMYTNGQWVYQVH